MTELTRRMAGAGLLAVAGWLAAPRALANPSGGLKKIDSLETKYNSIEIWRQGSVVTMNFKVGRCSFEESAYDTKAPDFLPVAYTRDATAALAYVDTPSSVMEIGLGGGRLISYLHRSLPKTRFEAVEIDPGVVEMARKHFDLPRDPRLRVNVADGRRFAAETKQKYDIIFVDAYRGTWVPETLTTVEFFQLLKQRLKPGGVVAQNVEPTTLFYDRMLATLFATFGNVDAYPGEMGREADNTMLVAYEGAPRRASDLAESAARLQAERRFRHDLRAIVAKRQVEQRPSAAPMHDGFEEANLSLMIDKANAGNTPRQRHAECQG